MGKESHADPFERPWLSVEEIKTILSAHFKEQDWHISKPRNGWQKESFIGQGGDDSRLFVKFDVDPEPLKRLGEIGIAPPFLSSGLYKGRPFSIQDYIEGEYPNRHWFQQHLKSLGGFVARYHRDQKLHILLPKSHSTSHQDFLTREVQSFQEGLAKHGLGMAASESFRQAFREFKAQARHFQEVSLVPTHGDPNRKNFLLLREQLFMIDWDELVLSDPMRDVGPFLWWHASPQTWGEFFESYGETLDESNLDRLYWWAARRSLHVALWTASKAGEPSTTEAFLEDFGAAVAQKANPH